MADGARGATRPTTAESTTSPLALTPKEKQIHDQGLVSVLKQLHDDLDAAVFEAYGWAQTLTDAEILERVVALNAERAKEEAAGTIRWLRPEYQNPNVGGTSSTSPTLNLPAGDDLRGQKTSAKGKMGARGARPSKAAKKPWPKILAERVKAVSGILRASHESMTPDQITAHFSRAKKEDISAILETLVVMGQARKGIKDGKYSG